MELHNVHSMVFPNRLGEEKQQMLSLNRRLETYLGRVKLLEEENELLAKEIRTIKHNKQGSLKLRKGLEEELRQARLEVDAAWRDRGIAELEVCQLTEELQAIDQLRQREAQAKVTAQAKLEQSRKELEEEERAQIWLGDKVRQLEHEMKLLIQTHSDNVSLLEDSLTQSKAPAPPTPAQRCRRTPDLLRMGEDFYQTATRAWQEAAAANRSQLARLEESLDHTRKSLAQVGQEKLHSQLKLQTLEKEMASAQDVRLHLEKAVDQQRHKHCQEMQQLQEYFEDLEVERQGLGQQIESLIQENCRLSQLKISLDLEVATYRALLDGGNLRGDASFSNRPRNIRITDAVFSPRGVKKINHTQLSAGHKSTFAPSLRRTAGPTITAAPLAARKLTTSILSKPADIANYATLADPYPKIVQDGAVENFRPQEVHEKVTHAEPLSPPGDEGEPGVTFEEKSEDNWSPVDGEEREIVESAVGYATECGFGSEQSFEDDHPVMETGFSSDNDNVTEEPYGQSEEPHPDVAEKESEQQLQSPSYAWLETGKGAEVEERVRESMSDFHSEAGPEPTLESEPGSLHLEREHTGSDSNQTKDDNPDRNISDEIAQKTSDSTTTANGLEVEYELYPDGEEMDTWDSVIERRTEAGTDVSTKAESKKQRAEPEEDISGKEPERKETQLSQDENMTSTLLLTPVNDNEPAWLDREQADKAGDDDDDEEDSQNVSVSWRTELEGDSYAQDNTLADTRPLIRYKSDEADGNTQASHMDESESSEGEQERKPAEDGAGTWSDSKSKAFGTMEDLCEEVEEEIMDDEYNLGYFNDEDRDVSQGTIVSERVPLQSDRKNEDEDGRNLREGHSEEESEELTRPFIDYDEELETDRLVEQELENLSTESYGSHFAQQAAEDACVVVQTEDVRVFEPITPTTITNQASENQYLTDSVEEMPPTDPVAVDDDKYDDDIFINEPKKKDEEDEYNISVLTRADAIEGHPGLTDSISGPNEEETDHPEDPSSEVLSTPHQENLQPVVAPAEVPGALPRDTSGSSHQNLVGDHEEFPEAAEVAEWEVLEEPGQDLEPGQQGEPDQRFGMLGSAEDGDWTSGEERVGVPPAENGVTVVTCATDSSSDLFLSDVREDFWVSSLETGAAYKPDDTWSEASELTGPVHGPGENQVWGNLENQDAVNENSRSDVDLPKASAPVKEQKQTYVEVTDALYRNVKGQLVNSDDLDVEAESWSFGKEPA
ncbi:nestin [Menidia menidia]